MCVCRAGCEVHNLWKALDSIMVARFVGDEQFFWPKPKDPVGFFLVETPHKSPKLRKENSALR